MDDNRFSPSDAPARFPGDGKYLPFFQPLSFPPFDTLFLTSCMFLVGVLFLFSRLTSGFLLLILSLPPFLCLVPASGRFMIFWHTVGVCSVSPTQTCDHRCLVFGSPIDFFFGCLLVNCPPLYPFHVPSSFNLWTRALVVKTSTRTPPPVDDFSHSSVGKKQTFSSFHPKALKSNLKFPLPRNL